MLTENNIQGNENLIHSLVTALENPSRSDHRKIRQQLLNCGDACVPVLEKMLSSEVAHTRWEAAKTLGALHDEATISALLRCLEDEDIGVRWVASEGLIAMGRTCIKPLMQALTERFHSIWLREGAQHILRSLRNLGMLHQNELTVLEALEGIEPVMTVPWAAEAVLRSKTLQ